MRPRHQRGHRQQKDKEIYEVQTAFEELTFVSVNIHSAILKTEAFANIKMLVKPEQKANLRGKEDTGAWKRHATMCQQTDIPKQYQQGG